MKSTLFLVGPSDIEGQSWTKIDHREAGRVKGVFQWSGLLPILPFVKADATLSAKSTFVFIGIHEKFSMPRNAHLNLFNIVGDADASVKILNIIQAMENKIQPQRYFNRTSDVFKTSRGRLPETLSDIPGCYVPHVEASDPKSFDELEQACEKFDTWPLILRARGYHGGENMILLSDRSQLDTIKDNPWLYDGIFLMEHVDYRNEGKLYQKTRVLYVGGIPYPRHSIISDCWSIHSKNRADLMDQDLELCHQEERFLAYLRTTGLREYGAVFSAIQKRIGLDIFGVDFALVDGKVVVFEANACMEFLSQDYGENGRYRYLESYVRDLKHAVTGIDQLQTIGGLSDPETAKTAIEVIGKEIPLWLGHAAEVTEASNGMLRVQAGEQLVEVERVFASMGRSPNLDKLGLANIGVELDARGIPVFDPGTMRVGDTPIYIAGDVTGERPLLHEAGDEGRIAGHNAISAEPMAFRRKTLLSITFCDPNIVVVGARFADLDPGSTTIGQIQMGPVGRAMIMAKNRGIIRVYADKASGSLLGAEMACPKGENLGHLLAWCIQQEMTVGEVLQMPFYHPVIEEALQAALYDLYDKVDAKNATPITELVPL